MASAGELEPKRVRNKGRRPPEPVVQENKTSGGHQAERVQTTSPFPVGSEIQANETSGRNRTKRIRIRTILPGSDLGENQETHTSPPLSQSNRTKRSRTKKSLLGSDLGGNQERHISSPLSQSKRSVSNESGRHQAMGGPPLQVYTRSKISTARLPDACDLVCDRKIDRVGLHEHIENPGKWSQFLDQVQKKVDEANNLAITNWRQECRSLIEERSSALQKSNEFWSRRLQVVGQSMILQLEAAVENFVDEVDSGFNNGFRELEAHKNSVDLAKQGFGTCLEEIRRMNSDTPLLIVDLQKSSGEHDSPEKDVKPVHGNGVHQSQGAQLNEASCQVGGIKPSPQAAESGNCGSDEFIDRPTLFQRIECHMYLKQVPFRERIHGVCNGLSQFLDRRDAIHDLEIAKWRAQCRSLHEETLILKKTNDALRNDNAQFNLRLEEARQKVISQFQEAVEKFPHGGENIYNNSSKILETTRNYICEMKRGLNFCVQHAKQVFTSVHEQKSSGSHDSFVISKTDHANGEMNGICGSYADDAGTPTLLQAALSNVKVAVNRLEKAVSKFEKSTEKKIGGLQTPEAGPNVFFARPNHSGYYVKLAMYRLLFEGFENESFNTSHGISRFLNPNLRQQNYYEYYLGEVDRSSTDDIEDTQFKEFCRMKISSLLTRILPKGTGTGMEINSLEELGDTQLPLSFRGAARSVWLLHKLAFCFDPPAAIFRVAAGVDVDPNYMETIIDLEDSEGLIPKVGFMVAPGLRLRRTILPCEVYLAAATKIPN